MKPPSVPRIVLISLQGVGSDTTHILLEQTVVSPACELDFGAGCGGNIDVHPLCGRQGQRHGGSRCLLAEIINKSDQSRGALTGLSEAAVRVAMSFTRWIVSQQDTWPTSSNNDCVLVIGLDACSWLGAISWAPVENRVWRLASYKKHEVERAN